MLKKKGLDPGKQKSGVVIDLDKWTMGRILYWQGGDQEMVWDI